VGRHLQQQQHPLVAELVLLLLVRQQMLLLLQDSQQHWQLAASQQQQRQQLPGLQTTHAPTVMLLLLPRLPVPALQLLMLLPLQDNQLPVLLQQCQLLLTTAVLAPGLGRCSALQQRWSPACGSS
jgi:hypothetical protein